MFRVRAYPLFIGFLLLQMVSPMLLELASGRILVDEQAVAVATADDAINDPAEDRFCSLTIAHLFADGWVPDVSQVEPVHAVAPSYRIASRLRAQLNFVSQVSGESRRGPPTRALLQVYRI